LGGSVLKSPLKTVLLLLGSVVALGALLSQPNPARHSKAARDAEVITDRADYAPGSTAAIVGSGFRPREQVRLQVLHADGTPSTGADHEPWFVRAGPQGDFVTAWHVCEDDCVGSALELTAVGQRSGINAQAQFTDAPSAGELLEGWFNLARQWGGTIQG